MAVLGLGYVGLPTACMLAVNGIEVLGVDTNADVVNELLDSRPRAAEPEIKSLLGLALHSGHLRLSTEVATCDCYIISVPTPIGADHTADLSHVHSALAAIVRVVQNGDMIILESTVPPGTTMQVLVPLLRNAGLEPGSDLHLAHCPERVLPGATMLELVQNDRIIGGLDTASARRAAQLYSCFVKGALHLTDVTTAEFVKVMENTYRDVNIGLANEFAKLADVLEVNVWEAIRLANNHPRVNILRPGPGVGGHCVAVDPWFLVQLDESRSRLVRTAREVNDGMPRYVIDRLIAQVNLQVGHVALLGLAYKADLADTRASPAVAIYSELRKRGIPVKAHDPVVNEPIAGIENVALEEAVRGAAALLIATDHATFRALDPLAIADSVTARIAFDTRECLDRELWGRAGFRVLGLGRPSRDAQ